MCQLYPYLILAGSSIVAGWEYFDRSFLENQARGPSLS